MILCYIESCKGDSEIDGFTNYFTCESFSFNVERELAESGKAGTSDVNIGVGELQECSISKSMDSASTDLAKKAISGGSCGTAEIKFVETIESGGKNFNQVYLWFKLDNAFIKTWSVSGDGDDRPRLALQEGHWRRLGRQAVVEAKMGDACGEFLCCCA